MAAISLYFCYIFGGMAPFGAIVAYLHDIADIFANFGKVLSSTTFEKGALADGIVLIIIWAYTRCYLLVKIIYWILTIPDLSDNNMKQFEPFIYLNATLLSVMCALHYMWFFMFMRMISRFLREGEMHDVGNRMEN